MGTLENSKRINSKNGYFERKRKAKIKNTFARLFWNFCVDCLFKTQIFTKEPKICETVKFNLAKVNSNKLQTIGI